MKKFFIIFSIVLIVLAGFAIGSYKYISSKIYVSPSSQSGDSNKGSNKGISVKDVIGSVKSDNGVTNIVLAGLDARNKDTDSRTDSIMMATIDGKNKEVKLTSFMRDMFVKIPGYSKEYKINTAYFLGGPSLLMETLNENFNLNTQYYVTIDFNAFQDFVDKLNGIDVDIKPYEIKEMNKYIKEANWSNPDFITKPGMQHINGQQALSYCRIRKVGNNDYERTERQRRVISLLITKARKESIFKLPGLFNSLLPYIKTNIPTSKLLQLGISMFRFKNAQISTLRIPSDGMFTNQVVGGQDVLVPDLEKNTSLLEGFIANSNSSEEKTAGKISNDKGSDAAVSTATDGAGNNQNESNQGNTSDTNSTVQKSEITVAILNSTGQNGLAAQYKTKLEGMGYNVVQTGNYAYKKYSSTLINDYTKKEYGSIVSKDLDLGNVVIKQKKKHLASIVIILGSDSIK